MSKRANPLLLGTFVILGLVLLAAGLIFFGSGRFFQQSDTFLLYFRESVNGLESGAPVKFKGVKIGRVKEIRIRYDQPETSDAIPVFIEIFSQHITQTLGVKDLQLSDKKTLRKQINMGMRAKMQSQSYVTGKLFVELDYYPDISAKLTQKGDKYLEIPTVSSNLAAMMNSATQLLASVNEVDFQAISKELTGALRGLRIALDELNFKQLNDNILSASKGLDELVNSPHVQSSLENVEGISEELLQLTRKLKEDISPLSKQMRDSLSTIEEAMQDVQQTISPRSSSRIQLEKTLKEFERAARSLRILSESLERHPSSLLRGKPPKTPEESSNKEK